MNVSTSALLKAVAKRKARGEPGEGQRAPAPKRLKAKAPERPAIRAPEPSVAGPPASPTQRGPPIVPEIDLTVDTPPEEGAAIGAPGEETAVERLAAPGGLAAGTAAAEGSATAEEPLAPGASTPPSETRSWGEGPSGASPPRKQAPTSSPRIYPEQGGGDEGSGSRLRAPPESVWVDGQWAEQILSPAFAPEILEELSRLNLGAFFWESCASLIKLANSLKAAKDAIQEGRGLVRESQREADEAQARAAAAEEALESARAAHAEEIKIAESLAESSANHLRASLAQVAFAESAVVARDLHISELTSAMQMAEDRAAEATERARVEEEKAKAEEEKAKAAEKGAKAAEERVKTAIEEANRAREAERAAEATLAAERGPAGIIEEYKASERFAGDLAEASATIFLKGFQHCKEKVARDFDLPQALEIEPDHVDFSDDESASAGL